MTKWTLSKANKNWKKIFTKDINSQFFNDLKIALKKLKRDSTLLIIRKMKSKMAKFRKFKIHSVGKIVGEQAFSYITGGNEKW